MKQEPKPTRKQKISKHGTVAKYLRAKDEKNRKEAGRKLNVELNGETDMGHVLTNKSSVVLNKRASGEI